MGERQFSDGQVKAILRRAIEAEQPRGGNHGDLSRAELIAAASELGLSAASVELAIQQMDREGELSAEIARLRGRRRRRLGSHALAWALTSALLFGVNWLRGGRWWFYWPALYWGVVLTFHALSVARRAPEEDEHNAALLIARRQIQREKQARRQEHKKLELTFERAISRGARALVGAAARTIHQAADSLDEKTAQTAQTAKTAKTAGAANKRTSQGRHSDLAQPLEARPARDPKAPAPPNSTR